MSFEFREKSIEVPFYCLTYGEDIYKRFDENIIVYGGERFHFHESTNSRFDLLEGQDICHRYSFSSMAILLCSIYNAKSYYQIEQIFDAMYPDKDKKYDYGDALKIYLKINSGQIPKTEMLHLFNQLLYILNNALYNLRPGDLSWNRSIGAAYDAESWELMENENGAQILITSPQDVNILKKLSSINVYPSTIYFYTAWDNYKRRPFLYSSNNGFSYERINAYQEYRINICIPSGNQYDPYIYF